MFMIMVYGMFEGFFFSFNPLTVGASSKYYLRLKIMILNKNYN